MLRCGRVAQMGGRFDFIRGPGSGCVSTVRVQTFNIGPAKHELHRGRLQEVY